MKTALRAAVAALALVTVLVAAQPAHAAGTTICTTLKSKANDEGVTGFAEACRNYTLVNGRYNGWFQVKSVSSRAVTWVALDGHAEQTRGRTGKWPYSNMKTVYMQVCMPNYGNDPSLRENCGPWW